MKFVAVVTLLLALLLPFAAQAAGGAAPCLATCLMSDTRIGLAMNEGKPIETYDWIRLVGNTVGNSFGLSFFTNTYCAYENGYKQAGGKGFCVGWLWGNRPGRMFSEYKLRGKEVLMCIPIVNIYPAIVIPCEAYAGKTLTEVIEEEGLRR